MSEFVDSALGDRIAFDSYGGAGDRPVIVFIAGAGPWRAIDPQTTATAGLLAERGVASIVPDRVGRGESFAEGPIALEREISAVAALIDAAGGRAVLCGHSSGCSISLYATAVARLAVAGLALWEAPLAPPGVQKPWVDEVNRHLDVGDLDATLRTYMRDMPPELLEVVMSTPAMRAQAGSLRPDADTLAWAGSAPHAELFGDITVPTLVMIGTESYDFMAPAAESITAAIPGARFRRVEGANHLWDPAAMAAELDALARRCVG